MTTKEATKIDSCPMCGTKSITVAVVNPVTQWYCPECMAMFSKEIYYDKNFSQTIAEINK
jgi:ribosomal protein L37AE/L43A